MYSNRRPYYGLKLSIADFFREPVRYLKQSNTQESMMEKPYLIDEYPKMHLSLPDFTFKPKKRPSLFGPIASGVPYGGLAHIFYGDARCGWDIARTGWCIREPLIITMRADYFWHAEFEFVAQIAEDTIGVTLSQLPGTEAFGWDEQDYLLTFPENASGSVTICGSASSHVLISQTFETVVAGMPVGIYFSANSLMAMEKGRENPAVLLKSSYGTKGDSCGCITISSQCTCTCSAETIGYTTQQMSVSEVQTLTVVDPIGGCTYDWSIASGGGSLSSPTGTSVNYTAPSTNAECAYNPTITLSIGGSVCDTLNLAVNAWVGNDQAFRKNVCDSEGTCTQNVSWDCANVTTKIYKCDGSYISNIGACPTAGCGGEGCCCGGGGGEGCSVYQDSYCQGQNGQMSCAEASEQAGCDYPGVLNEATDTRSSALVEGGCCPEELL